MAFTATAANTDDHNNIPVTVVINNITRSVVVGVGDLDGPPMAKVEFDEALRIILKAMWYGSSATTTQKLTALRNGVNLATATLKLRNYIDNVDVTS